MAFRIYEYGINKVITKTGQGDVGGFMDDLLADAELLKILQSIHYRKWTVVVGYHGDENGNWDRAFDEDEMKNARLMGQRFNNVALHETHTMTKGLSDLEITNFAKDGNVFFTWCDANRRVKALLGHKMTLLNVGLNK